MIPGLKHPSLDPNSDRPKTYCPPESSRTKQAFKEETDINVIVRRFIRTGTIDENAINKRQGAFLDATAIPGYDECLQRIQDAGKAFQTLPAATREMFDNNPASLIEWIDDPLNKTEAESLGLLPKAETQNTGQPGATPPATA